MAIVLCSMSASTGFRVVAVGVVPESAARAGTSGSHASNTNVAAIRTIAFHWLTTGVARSVI
jgi:hypothetical protein